jgi:DNA-binding NarL/FixJ family response regulator
MGVLGGIQFSGPDRDGSEIRRKIGDQVMREFAQLEQQHDLADGLVSADDWHERSGLVHMIDRLAAGVFLVNAGGRILHINARGRAMLAEADALIAQRGVLRGENPKITRALCEVFDASARDGLQIGRKGVAVPLAGRSGKRYLAHVLPLAAAGRPATGPRSAVVAAVLVRRAGLDLSPPVEAIAKLYDLTASELRTFDAIVQAGNVPKAAALLGVLKTTVRTHLQHVFSKTGARSQADLVKLVASIASPFPD